MVAAGRAFLSNDCLIKFHILERVKVMKVKNSIKSLRNRHRDCRVVRRRGRLFVINKTNRRFKARQG